jgi:hypothetical protein
LIASQATPTTILMGKIDSMSSALDLGVRWRIGKQGVIYSLVDGGGGAAHRKWRRREAASGSLGGESANHGALPARARVRKKERGWG